MISYLSGRVHQKSSDSLTLVVSGIGYLVFMSPSPLSKIKINDNIELHIHTHVREDLLDLYGFTSAEGLTLFKLLINVSGIGPKTALAVLDRGPEAVEQAIIKADEGFFTLVPRLGKKNAQKIIIELKNKLGSEATLDLSGTGDEINEVVQALLSMGYTRIEALNAARNIPSEISTTEEQIIFVLRQMNKPKINKAKKN